MPARKRTTAIIPIDRVAGRIYFIRGQRVILSPDLAVLYGVEHRALNQAVQRNKERFPDDFMFQLSITEFRILKSQFVTSNRTSDGSFLRSQSVTLNPDLRGKHLKYRPFAFTEQGVAMLSAVLRSPTAVRVSIEIVRAFVRLRQLLATHEELRQKLEALENKLDDHDQQILAIVDTIRQLMDEPDGPQKKKPPIGFHTEIAHPPKARRN